METKQYSEYEKQTDGKWIKQHPETEAGNIKGLNRSITFGVVEDIIKNPTVDTVWNTTITKDGFTDNDVSLAQIKNNQIEIQKSGRYYIFACIHMQVTNVMGTYGHLDLLRNGALKAGFESVCGGRYVDRHVFTVEAVLSGKAGDIIRIQKTTDLNGGAMMKDQTRSSYCTLVYLGDEES